MAGGARIALQDMIAAGAHVMASSNVKKQLDTLEQQQLTVAVPLPKRAKDQINRKVAYDAAATDVTKWVSLH